LASLTPLPGDASNRRYYRIHLTGGPPHSLILMQLAAAESFKASEEAVSGTAAPMTELPFINVLRHLQQAQVAVPTLHYFDQAAGLLYLEDFGDLTLAEACLMGTPADMQALYRLAIDTLITIHAKATPRTSTDCLAFHRGFDVALLMWEFDHFLEYGLDARVTTPMPQQDRAIVRGEFQKLAELIASLPSVFTHRDYHSRNLMVDRATGSSTRLGVIDFQDALMGPAAYDMASLLRDAYIALPEPLIDELIARYLNGMGKAGVPQGDPIAFRRAFDFTSIQRNMKAAGRFVYIDRVKGNPKFLADIPRVLGYVKGNFAKYPELDTLRTLLTPYVPELR
jgi:aminoglycoside/choline kinase family phosphotransferase